MTSILSKVRVAVLSNLHGLLDRAVNTPEGFRQYIRDLETAQGQILNAVDEANADVTRFQRKITENEDTIATMNGDIDLLLGDDNPDNDEAALQLQLRVDELVSTKAGYAERLAEAMSLRDQLTDAHSRLETRRRQMVSQYEQLTIQQASARAKQRAASAAEAASRASDAASSASIDSMADRIGREHEVANARFERVMGGLTDSSSPEEQVRLARARAALEERRRRIASAAGE